MPNGSIKALSEQIDNTFLTILRLYRPTANFYFYWYPNYQHLQSILIDAEKHKILNQIDICVALGYMDVIVAALTGAIEKAPREPWLDEYVNTPDKDVILNKTETIICVIALMLASKGTLGEDQPFNNASFVLLINKHFTESSITPQQFNQYEFDILKLIGFVLPRTPVIINYYHRIIFNSNPSSDMATSNNTSLPLFTEYKIEKYTTKEVKREKKMLINAQAFLKNKDLMSLAQREQLRNHLQNSYTDEQKKLILKSNLEFADDYPEYRNHFTPLIRKPYVYFSPEIEKSPLPSITGTKRPLPT